jgi:Uma2 family endonuclease
MAETDAHRDQMVEIIEGLKLHYFSEPQVYVTGNILLYYVEGDNTKSVSPDVMVVKGISKRQRRIFCLWEEHPPAVIFEISSSSTKSADFKSKLELYAGFGVPEYYIFDPEQKDPHRAFVPFRLLHGSYQRVAVVGGRIFSPELGLEIVQVGQALRLFDPVKQEWIPTRAEAEAARQHAESARGAEAAARQRAEDERARETAARQRAEEDLQQAAEKIARLQKELEFWRGKPENDEGEV